MPYTRKCPTSVGYFPGASTPPPHSTSAPRSNLQALRCPQLPIRVVRDPGAGPFQPKKGGYLALWELKLVIEFPPGALVLIPSATITHSNVAVAEA